MLMFSTFPQLTSGYLIFCGILTLFAISQLCRVVVDVWIGVWAQDVQDAVVADDLIGSDNYHGENRAYSDAWYSLMLVMFTCLLTVLVVVRGYVFTLFSSRNLHMPS